MTDFLDCIRPADDEPISPDRICKRRTWCTRPEHAPETPCLEKPRNAQPATDFGPRRAVKVGWG